MTPGRAVLLVEPDPECGRATASLLRREGHRVRLARSARSALQAAARESFDLAVVDLLVPGGGVELARRLTPRVRRLYLAVGAPLLPDEIVEAAVGFPVLRKTAVPGLVASSAAVGSGRRPLPAPRRASTRRRQRRARARAS